MLRMIPQTIFLFLTTFLFVACCLLPLSTEAFYLTTVQTNCIKCGSVGGIGGKTFQNHWGKSHKTTNHSTTSFKVALAAVTSSSSIDSPFPFPMTQTSEWDVNLYQDRHSFVWEFGSSLIDILDPKPGEYILDVGCGSGELVNQIAERGAVVIGIDQDANMIKRAQDQYESSGCSSNINDNSTNNNNGKRVSFFQADVRKFKLVPDFGSDDAAVPAANGGNSNAVIAVIEEDEPKDSDYDTIEKNLVQQQNSQLQQVDAIFSNAALHWVKDDNGGAESAVKAMSQALKPGGRFVVEFGGKGNIAAIVKAAWQVQNQEQNQHKEEDCNNNNNINDNKINDIDPPCWYFPSIAEYATLLERHGIEVSSAALFDRPTPLEDGEHGMKNWLTMFGDGLFQEYKSNKEEKERLIDKTVELLRSTTDLYQNGRWTADYRRIRIIGRKIAK